IKQKLEEEIDFQEKLIENQRNNFYDKQLDYELSKELHMYQIWRDEISSYIQNKYAVGSNKLKKNNLLEYNQSLIEQNRKLLESNKSLVERIEELKLEIKLLNDEINKVLKEKRG
ncbi:MAG: hypothetical protein WCQ84_06705, partial [Defluviitoga tunisiensis]